LELKEAVLLNNHVQTKNGKKQEKRELIEEQEKKLSEKPESDELQKVIRERIERVKKAFKPTWLEKDLNSQESKKGK
jgi:hypothetical protein